MKDDIMNAMMDEMKKNGYTTVSRFAEVSYTSESTIRRRLAELEALGLVIRSYGGARLKSQAEELPIELRLQKDHHAKDQIAKKAATLVQDNSVIFIDASSTCLHLAPYLGSKTGVTVYTYGTELCAMLSGYPIKLYCLGGAYNPVSKAFSGEYAIQMAQSLFFDAFFFSSSGYCDGYITDYSEPETHLRRAVLEHSTKRYFLCDGEKFGKKSPYVLCRDDRIDRIITNKDI